MTPTLRILALVTPHGRRLLAAAAAAVCAELAAVALMATAAWLISRAAQRPEIAVLAGAIVAVRALALSRGALRYADRLIGHDAVLRAVAGLRARVYEALVPLAPAGTPAFRSGDLLSRLVADVDAVQDLLLRCLLPAVVAVTVGLGAVTLALTLLPAAAAALLVGLLVAGALVPVVAARSAGGDGSAESVLRGELVARSVDLTRGAADLVAFGAAAAHLDATAERSAALARVERRRAWSVGLASAVVLVVQGATVVAVTALAVAAHDAGTLSPVHLAVLAVLALTTFEVVSPLPAAARRFVEVRASARRLVEVLDAPAPVAEPAAADAAELPARPTIVVTGLRARYPGAARPALDGVDLRLEPGRRVALTGASGSGKSTLAAVLMRFLEIDDGSVTVDGRDLRSWSGDDARRMITGVTQDAHVFATSIRDNVRLARPDATHDQLCTAAARARILDWIESLPQSWDTTLGDNGSAMSGGQRQRLLLARALLADPPVLVLDEPTEGLEPDVAAELLADLLRTTAGRTVLLITHQPPEGVDEVVTLDQGRVAARRPTGLVSAGDHRRV